MSNPLSNRNFLSPVGFKLQIERMAEVDFFCKSTSIPEVSASFPRVSSFNVDFPVTPDKMNFSELSVEFLIDEDLKNYSVIQNWLRGMTKPEYYGQTGEFSKQGNYTEKSLTWLNEYTTLNLFILTSNFNNNIQVQFYNAFPISINTLEFNVDTKDIEYLVGRASFQYSHYNIFDNTGKKTTL